MFNRSEKEVKKDNKKMLRKIKRKIRRGEEVTLTEEIYLKAKGDIDKQSYLWFLERSGYVNEKDYLRKSEYQRVIERIKDFSLNLESLDMDVSYIDAEYVLEGILGYDSDKWLARYPNTKRDLIEIAAYREKSLDNLDSGIEFESFIVNLLKKENYKKVQLLPASGDYGTDVLAEKNGIKYAIQCKYYSSNVGISAVQEIMGGKNHYGTHVAVVVTNNYFTKNAINLANSNGVILWDRPFLLAMIAETKVNNSN